MPTCSPYERPTSAWLEEMGREARRDLSTSRRNSRPLPSESVGALSLVGRLRRRSGAASAETLGGRCDHALGESSEEGDAEDAAEIGADPDQS